ncbi:unnamed protein product, partial [Didymodactylos carnosus]
MPIIGSLSIDEDRFRARRAKDVERKRRERSSDKNREYEREADRSRRTESRSRQTEVEREAGRAVDRQQKAELRFRHTEVEREANRVANRQQIAESRSRRTEVEREAGRAVDRQQKAELRFRHTEVEREANRVANRQQIAESRSRQTKEQKKKKQERNSSTRALRNAEIKQTKSASLPWPSRIPYDVKRSCYGNFLEMTSMSSLAENPCAICNTRVLVKDMELIPHRQLQQSSLLAPDYRIQSIIPGSRRASTNWSSTKKATPTSITGVVFVGSSGPIRGLMSRILTVRKQKVRNALEWLIRHNPLYRNSAKIDYDKIDILPNNDIPEPLWQTMTVSTNVEEMEAERSGYVPDPLANVVFEGEQTEISVAISGVVDVEGTAVSSEDITNRLLEKVRIDSSKPIADISSSVDDGDQDVYVIPHARKPAMEYSNPQLLMGLFPTLFPCGCGGIEDERP